MNAPELPFNQLLGIETADPPALLQLPDHPQLHNHLGTLHAAALFALAEASSAQFLVRCGAPDDGLSGRVRSATTKYSLAGHGQIHSSSPTTTADYEAARKEVSEKGETLFPIRIDLHNSANTRIAHFVFTWFLSSS